MFKKLSSTKYVWWQFLFVLLSTTWLWAPLLNRGLSYRTALISQYEVPGQPYFWLFKMGDVLGALLLIVVAYRFREKNDKHAYWLLLIIGLGMLADPVFSTSCRLAESVCRENITIGFVLHAVETTITASAIFLIAVYDYCKYSRLLSAGFVLFQILYGALFVSQLADQNHFNTASQFTYQVIIIAWLAWYVKEQLFEPVTLAKNHVSLVRKVVATWAFINGMAGVLVSFAHLKLLGALNGLYVANDQAWLAQHSAITGLVMIYLSRHLLRGDRRARQIFVALLTIEALKYSVISPNPILLATYMLTGLALFVLRDEFDRGTVTLTWSVRFQNLRFLLFSALSIWVIGFAILYMNHADITLESIDNFFDYTLTSRFIPKGSIQSALLAHTLATLLLAVVALSLGIVFKPTRKKSIEKPDMDIIKTSLGKYSTSPEDFFKLWPQDKQYFMPKKARGFIAYKQVGSIAFALADPIGSPSNRTILLQKFVTWTRANRLRACFLPVPESSLGLYSTDLFNTIQIGAGAVVHTQQFTQKTSVDKWWRWQKNRARKNGYLYSLSQPPHSPALMRQFKQVSDSWLRKEGRQEHGFALGYFNQSYLQQCTVHYLHTSEGKIIAFANQLPNFKSLKTASIDLIRYNAQLDNLVPYLLLNVIENLAPTHQFFDLGFVPFASTKGSVVTIAKTLAANRFSAKGLEQFKNKFDPVWQPHYLAYDGDLADLALVALSLPKVMATQVVE